MDKVFFHQLLYSLVEIQYEEGQVILKQGDSPLMLIVSSGCLEVFTYFEGQEFVLAKLPPGSILNYRSLFLQEPMAFNVRCTQSCSIIEIN